MRLCVCVDLLAAAELTRAEALFPQSPVGDQVTSGCPPLLCSSWWAFFPFHCDFQRISDSPIKLLDTVRHLVFIRQHQATHTKYRYWTALACMHACVCPSRKFYDSVAIMLAGLWSLYSSLKATNYILMSVSEWLKQATVSLLNECNRWTWITSAKTIKKSFRRFPRKCGGRLQLLSKR